MGFNQRFSIDFKHITLQSQLLKYSPERPLNNVKLISCSSAKKSQKFIFIGLPSKEFAVNEKKEQHILYFIQQKNVVIPTYTIYRVCDTLEKKQYSSSVFIVYKVLDWQCKNINPNQQNQNLISKCSLKNNVFEFVLQNEWIVLLFVSFFVLCHLWTNECFA